MDIHQLLEMGKCSIKHIGCIRYSQLRIFLVGKKIGEIGRETPIRRSQTTEELFPSRDFEHSLVTLPPAGYPLDLLRVATVASATHGRPLKKIIMLPKCTQCDNLIQ